MLFFVGLMNTRHFRCFIRSFDRAESSLSNRYTSFWSISDWLNAIEMMLVFKLRGKNKIKHSAAQINKIDDPDGHK